MPDIVIDLELANLCRPLTDEEKAQLEANLKADGCIDPLRLWGNILLDGHNRHEICVRLGLPFRTEVVEIADRGAAINWVIANQLGRRNLIPEEASYLRGKKYEIEKVSPAEHRHRAQTAATAAALLARGLVSNAEEFALKQGVGLVYQNGTPDQSSDTGSRIAKELGVGRSTLLRDGNFALAVDRIGAALGQDTANLIRMGKAGLTKKAVIEFSNDGEMTVQKFNELRYATKQRHENAAKKRKRNLPKAPPLTIPKRPDNYLETRFVERMRPFMNALIQIATAPVVASTLASDPWPPSWRKQVQESLPLALAYLQEFDTAFKKTAPSSAKE